MTPSVDTCSPAIRLPDMDGAPVFDIAKEVVQTAVGSEVLPRARPGGLREGNVFSARDRHAVVRVGARITRDVARGLGRVDQAVGVRPLVREYRERRPR